MTHAANARPGDAPRDPSADAAQTGPPEAKASGAGWWRSVTPNTIVAGGVVVFAAVIALAAALLVAQLSAINDGIGRLDTKIDNVETNLNARIDNVEANLRREMQAGFAQINNVLLDHTDRLARLETHAGLAAAAPHS